MILTSNQSFGSWGEGFGDRVIATAILDRVLHHAITINIRGNSYLTGGGFSMTTSGENWMTVDTSMALWSERRSYAPRWPSAMAGGRLARLVCRADTSSSSSLISALRANGAGI